jgi:hypothetical protein
LRKNFKKTRILNWGGRRRLHLNSRRSWEELRPINFLTKLPNKTHNLVTLALPRPLRFLRGWAYVI